MIKPKFKEAAKQEYVYVEIKSGVYKKMPKIKIDMKFY